MKKLRLIIKHFSHLLERNLRNAYLKGAKGWDDHRICPDELLRQKLLENLEKQHYVDVAAYAMFLYFRHHG